MKIDRVDKSYDIVFAILLFMLPISVAIPNFCLGILIMLFVLKKRKSIFKNEYIKLLFLFVLYFILKAIFNNVFIENINQYKHILIVMIVSILSFNIVDEILIKKAFLTGLFVAVIYSFFKIGVYYYQCNILPLGNSYEVKEMLLIHRPYFGFMCFLGIVFALDLIKRSSSSIEKYVYISLLFILFLFTYLIVARLSMLLILLFFFFKFIFSTEKKTVLILVLFIATFFVTLIFNNNFQKRFHIQSTLEETKKVFSNQEPRVVIWDCGFTDLLSDKEANLLLGYKNPKNIQSNLNDCYEHKIENISKREYYLATEFNTHNQFLDFFLQGGIIGLLLFTTLFIYSIYTLRHSKTAVLILFSFFLFCFFENILHRQLGAYLFGIFIPLYFSKTILKE